MSDLAGMKIGEVAEQTGLSIRTLRHYDDLGVVTPSGRTPGGFRLYAAADVERLLLIRRMKPLEFSLEEIRTFLHSVDTLRAMTPAPAQNAPEPEVAGAENSAGEIQDIAAANLSWIREETTTRLAKLRQRVSYAEEFLTLLEEVTSPAGPSPTD